MSGTELGLALSVLVACAVEAVEALTIVLAVGTTRSWPSALYGTGAAVAALAAVVAALGPALTALPLSPLRLVIGGFLLVFGLQWLRKAVLRAAGLKALHDEAAAFEQETAAARAADSRVLTGIDTYSFVISFKGVLLEGLEVAVIVLTFGANQHRIGLAAAAAGVAVALVVLAGLAARAPLARVPENWMKFSVGVMLSSFGMFWGAEGAGASWPGNDAALLVIVPGLALAALAMVVWVRRMAGQESPRRPRAWPLPAQEPGPSRPLAPPQSRSRCESGPGGLGVPGRRRLANRPRGRGRAGADGGDRGSQRCRLGRDAARCARAAGAFLAPRSPTRVILPSVDRLDVNPALEPRAMPGPSTAPIGRPAPAHGPVGNAFPPIAGYGFLSDCETVALVAPGGSVEWMCLPRVDSPSVFGAMLDRDAGYFRLSPAGVSVPASRRYLPGTMVLETSWRTGSGWIIVRDLLLIGPWHHEHERSHTHRRAPTDYDSDHVLLRTVRCVNGEVEVLLDCEPVFDYGRKPARWDYAGAGYHEGVARVEGVDLELRLTTDLRLGFEGPRATARHRMKEGEQRFCALSWSEHPAPQSFEEAYRRLVWTAHHWQHWLDRGQFPDHPWSTYLQRSALTLKGLTYEPSGALIAAATTSLPETPHGERNWDYRYSWIRDSTFMLWGLYTLGFDWEANDFFYFIADVAEGADDLQVMYGVGGERALDEQTLDHLNGYEGARPVRTGNAAYKQQQHDVWGALLDSVYLHTRSRDSLDERVWPILKRQVEAAIAHWREPDRGIWEVRGDPKHFTSSKMFCWVACDRGARLAEIREDAEHVARWQAAADEIHADICERGVDERGVFVQHYDTTALDASLLLLPLVRFLPPSDDRVRATVFAIADELTEQGLVLRYRTDETDDGLSGREGTFMICSFWLVSALIEIGELERGRGLCERLLGFASPLGLYAEEVEARTGRHLGNFPQAFTHLALINAVMHVIRAEQDVELAQSPWAYR